MPISTAAADPASVTTPRRGYSANKDQLRKRLRRIEGQVRGIDGPDELKDDRTEELMAAVARLMRRG
jgi:predicted Ser/Thr protein kinase